MVGTDHEKRTAFDAHEVLNHKIKLTIPRGKL